MSNIKLFEEKKIRSVWNEEEENWYFVVADVIQALTGTADTKDYLKKMRRRDSALSKGWGQIVTPLPVETAGGKKFNFANTQTQRPPRTQRKREEYMNTLENAPDFTLRDGDGNDWKLSDYRGKPVVLLFYPGDNTPVCTAQMCSIRDHWSEYQATGAEVVGISTDTVESHKGFAEKNELPLRLLSDSDRKVSAMYDMKSWLPGRSARGVVVIDADGNIAYHKVQAVSLFKPSDDDVLAAILLAKGY